MEGINLVTLRTKNLREPNSLKTYLSIGGYDAWKRILSDKILKQDIISEIKASGLRGRGGAGFLTGLKWSFIQADDIREKYLVCNADEGEPGTFKDHEIMQCNPHQLLEGMMIASYAIGAHTAYNYLRGEFKEVFNIMERALEEAYNAGLLGKNILHSGYDLAIYNLLGAGAYICGEETALIESIEGKKGLPRFKPPFPAHQGLFGMPTVVNNVETLATVPLIMQHGAKWHTSYGKPNNAGYKVFSVSGHVKTPGNYEIPLGTPFKKLLQLAGGMKNNAKLKAVIPGGSSSSILPANIIMDLDLDYDSLAKAGSMLGSGGVIVMDDSTNMAKVLLKIARFYYEESCGQCTPCREGTGWIYRLVSRIALKEAKDSEIDLLYNVASKIEGRTICAFGEAVAWPVKGFIRHFRDDLYVRR